jgi:hypothetical protein
MCTENIRAWTKGAAVLFRTERITKIIIINDSILTICPNALALWGSLGKLPVLIPRALLTSLNLLASQNRRPGFRITAQHFTEHASPLTDTRTYVNSFSRLIKVKKYTVSEDDSASIVRKTVKTISSIKPIHSDYPREAVKAYMFGIPHCLANRLRDGSEVVRLTHRPRSTPQIFFAPSGTYFC